MGADLTKISNESLAILKNKDLIDINQDPESKQATCVHGCDWWSSLAGEPVIYSTKTGNGEIVALVYNWRPFSSDEFSFTLKNLGVNLKEGEIANMVNLWDKTSDKVRITSSSQKMKVGNLKEHGSFTAKITVFKADEKLDFIQ